MTESGALPRAALVALAVVLVALPVTLAAARPDDPSVPAPKPGTVELLRQTGRGHATFRIKAPAGTDAIAVTIACRGDDVAVWTTRGASMPCGSGGPTRLVLPAVPGSNAVEVSAEDTTRYALAVTATHDEPDTPLG